MHAESQPLHRFLELYLKLLGTYPGVSHLKGFFFIFFCTLLLIPFLYWKTIVSYGDLDKFMAAFGPALVITNFFTKMMILRVSYRNVQYLVKDIIDDFMNIKEKSIKTEMSNNLKISGSIYKVIAVTYNSLTVVVIVTALIDNYKASSVEEAEYFLPAVYPLINKTWRNMMLLDVVQVTQMIIVGNGHSTIEGLLALLVFHAATKSYIVRVAIKNYSNICCTNKDEESIQNAARNLFEKHRRYLKFSRNVEAAFSWIVLCHLFIIILQTVVIGYVLITTLESDTITTQFYLYLDFFIADIWGAILYCAAGEYFTKQGDLIYDDLFNCPWYKFPQNDVKAMLLLFIKAQNPVVITVGKFSDLSLIYFTSMMKASFSYLSVVRVVQVSESG